jgi:acyl-CoA thioesterase FadM
MGADAFVQVATDGTGKKIRNIAVEAVQADGTIAVVYQQVVAIYDEKGRPVELIDHEWKAAVLDRLDTLITIACEAMASHDGPGYSQKREV